MPIDNVQFTTPSECKSTWAAYLKVTQVVDDRLDHVVDCKAIPSCEAGFLFTSDPLQQPAWDLPLGVVEVRTFKELWRALGYADEEFVAACQMLRPVSTLPNLNICVHCIKERLKAAALRSCVVPGVQTLTSAFSAIARDSRRGRTETCAVRSRGVDGQRKDTSGSQSLDGSPSPPCTKEPAK